MKTKKILSLLVASTLIVTCLTACGKVDTTEVTETSETQIIETTSQTEVEPTSDPKESSSDVTVDEGHTEGTDSSVNTLAYDPEESINGYLLGLCGIMNAWSDYNGYDVTNPYGNAYTNAITDAYLAEINESEPFIQHPIERNAIIGYVPEGQAAEWSSDEENKISSGDIVIDLWEDDMYAPSDVCFIVVPYGDEIKTLSDIFAESDYDDIDQLINDEANGVVHADVRTYIDGIGGTHIYGYVSQNELFNAPGDYAIIAYGKIANGEWHKIENAEAIYVAVRDLVAEGIVDNY